MKKSVWLPAAVAPIVVAAAIAAPSIASAAGSTDSSSAPTAASVLASVAKAKDVAYSGRLAQTSDLGLPSLPSSSAGSSDIEGNASGLLDLLTSSHSARIYVDGATKARVQLLGSLSEQDVIVNGHDVWTWDSQKNRATHVTLPSSTGASTADGTATPAEIATRAIAAITPSTRISTPVTASVAGRTAWRVVLTPKSDGTLVKTVTLDVDKQTGLPLSAEIDAKGQSKAAVSVEFTNIDFSAPASRLFDFTPPSGAEVTTKDLSKRPASSDKHSDAMKQGTIEGTTSPSATPTVTGTGWRGIVELPAGTAVLSGAGQKETQLLDQLTTTVSGGRAIQTSLVSVYITTDGRVFAGAVPVSALIAAAQ